MGDRMKTRFIGCWCIGAAILAFCAGSAIAGQPSKAHSSAVAVDRCVDLFGSVDILEEDHLRQVRLEAQHERLAREYFSSWSRNELSHTLTPALRTYKPSDVRFVSIAYTLAYYNIDVEANAARIVKFIGANMDLDSLDTAGARLHNVYRRHPSSAVMRDILTMRGDAEIQLGYDGERISIFLESPAAVLKEASASKAAMRGLTEALENMDAYRNAEEHPVNLTLRNFSHNRNPKLAATARKIRAAIVSYQARILAAAKAGE